MNLKESNYDILIVGAGIIGASVAYKLSKEKNFKIAVLDKEATINKHQTGRNSGVIHSGVYYPKDSLKSKNCIDGYYQLIEFLKKYKIPYKLTGKLIAISDESEIPELERLYDNALDVGLNVRYVNEQEIKAIDPNLVSKKGFYVPETGFTDYKLVLETLKQEGEKNGVDFIFNTKISSVNRIKELSQVHTDQGKLSARYLVNCTGLQCDRVYEKMTNKKSPVTIIPFKGEYFKVESDKYSSDIPVYPVPNPDFPFLGVHLTRMIDGTLKVGPNAVLVFDREGYDGFNFRLKDFSKVVTNKALFNVVLNYKSTVVKELLKHGSMDFFEKNVKKYWSAFDKEDITGYTCGIRAQATENGKLLSDFRIERFENQVHVLNAPSPAATSCLAIADTIITNLNL